ncbi:asparagine synthase (glutamine-hydrolyzing) [Desulfogranum marinum]|uniref:asparagine synthase (glutamine-hydrolyzing) n=1 Tax=Desulfogranum marinum TaxID=453220 RepID=UPI0019666582|nr:asparagine synthase (glutamine-hydrolyzing) [Desulfogranum marinum]MBM9512982.1 asparagine synthase (glutamine-hydrolyzing) [Desulfogranum marinum]
MCGIVGKLGRSNVSLLELQSMARSIAHRGPDDEGYWVQGKVGLGHRRLSIIDLASGKQPISNEDQTIWIVFNGEIYNFPEIKKELLSKGHQFSTNTDTEVIVHLYEEMGQDCVQKLNGMFAFAIWDDNKKQLFLARDRIGQKPLFYRHVNGEFLFGSEVKAILAADNVERNINYTAIHHYLSLRFIPAPHTMFEGIQKLPAGSTLLVKEDKITVKRYWDLTFTDKLQHTETDFLDGLEEQLGRAVTSHLISDVPVGAFLSGGMDTSTVVALMAEAHPDVFKTFAIGVKEQDFNELPFAKVVADTFHTQHVEEVVSANLIQLMPQMVWHLDEPSDSIAACMFQAAKLASQHVKVVMGGDGGDELFAGFDRYMGVGYINYYNMLPSFVRKKLLHPLFHTIPDSFTYKSLVQKLRWMDQLSDFDEGERYAEATAFFRFSHTQKQQLFSEKLWGKLADIDSNQVIVEHYNKPNATDSIDKMLYADFMTRLSEHTLMLTDRMNMAFSLEARSPFLDHELVEYLARFPSNIKIKGRQLKYILRKFAERKLPKEITSRQKQGFMFPVAYWFRNELYPFVRDQLENSFFVREGLFQKDYVSSLVEDHRNNKEDNHVRLWMLLNMEVWHQLYIEQRDPASVSETLSQSANGVKY